MSDKTKRRYSDPTKSDYIIRCMAAENTVRQQDKALAEEKQCRAKAEWDAWLLQEEVDRLRKFGLRFALIASTIGYVIGYVIGRAI